MNKQKKSNIEVGQTIWINRKQLYMYGAKESLEEYKVSKVNSTSVYIEKEGVLELRLNKKDLSYKDGFLYSYQGYLSPDDYWNPIKEREKKNKLIKEINEILICKSAEELEMIKNYIEQGDK